ncbi:mitogen-activated protein kinase kinase kinase [Malassezia caprae]|uniref:Mitogen-activated protein kinase kinase kinase n=1 Tax=Malassezia caprae TaxID=1381934 RepID=A0AAF0J1R5_9BASI|nr:mitogen-activated protein kinase kinase kinase [Malassezia caprae]
MPDTERGAQRGSADAEAPMDLVYLYSYMDRGRPGAWPADMPAQMSTPQAERCVLEQVSPEDDPKKRMEWQKMLRSVLESEVLSSETKRITAADAAMRTPAEQMHRLWLSLHAIQAGHTDGRDDPEAEEHLLQKEREATVPALMRAIEEFAVSCDEDADAVFARVGQLLDNVQQAKRLFPSLRQMAVAYPDWVQLPLQTKLNALSAWHNVTRELKSQASLLRGWSGSLTSPGGALRPALEALLPGDGERDRTVAKRLSLEGNVQQTFEQRTLRRLRMLVEMTHETLRTHYTQLEQIGLPSFEPHVLPLVCFPMWLAEAALRQRLEYADKLREPSVLLVDSLADDLRAALALACRIKAQYMQLTVPEPDIGWNLPLKSDDSFDAAVCSALHFFFRLLHFRLKSAPFFKEVDVIEPEWHFLSQAVRVVPGADVIVAHKMSGMVNRLFARLMAYFQKELKLPVSTREAPPHGPRQSPLPVQDMTRSIHAVFNHTRMRSRRLTGFARRLRGALESACEYDLRTLRSHPSYDLHTLLQTLLQADYFLVYTSSFEERGIFVLAEPSLHDKPHTIQDLLFQCVRASSRPHEESTPLIAPESGPPPPYLLLLTPCEPFLWTGRVMTLTLPWIDVDLKEQRLRLVADGAGTFLEQAKRHLARHFAAGTPSGDAPSAFPLKPVYDRMSHLGLLQHELKLMCKAGYVLTDQVVHSVPVIRQQMLRLRPLAPADRAACDELVQMCFSMAFDHGARGLGYVQSVRLNSLLSTALAQLSVEWISFVCDDCVLTERRTFKWAVSALENAMTMTLGENIFLLSENEFFQLRSCVSSCMALLISHFDILGARSNAVKEQEQRRAQIEREAAQVHRAPETAEHEQRLTERRVAALSECDRAREAALAERHVIGRVLDDTRMEDRGLQLLASKGVQMRWQQGRFIGGGTFGTVYLGVNLDTGGLMAVKEIRFQELTNSPSLYKQIHDEMHVMEMLRHPNIVEYYGIEVHREKVYIFEEYCQGGSLAQLLEHGRIEDEIVLQVYTLQMLDGLMYLHSKGVVHRDIKPENILLDHMGVIKFVDFGAAKVLSKNSRTFQASRRGPRAPPGEQLQSLQGTPMYMSPEVVRGEHNGREGAMDIWSLGCVILECAKGQRPWSQLDNEWAIMFHIGMAQQHPALPDESQLSALGIDFLRQCLTIDPFRRPTAVELRQHEWIRGLVEELHVEAEAEEAEALAAAREEEEREPVTPAPPEPGHPSHRHPGYEALVADVQYRREGQQIKAMLAPD